MPCLRNLPKPWGQAHIVVVQAAKELSFISSEEYLQRERGSDMRHEFVGGVTYAMAGASEEHNTIAGNLHAALHAHLRGRSCRVFIVDLKVSLQVAHTEIFYYPDLMVVCDPRDTDRYFKRYPKVLIEVLSEDTEHIDRREKFLNYTQIGSLEEYALVAQDRMEATLFRRSSHWKPVVLSQPDQILQLTSLAFHLPLSAVYDGVKL